MQDTERIAIRPLDGGLNLSRNPVLLRDSESPDLQNVELSRNSVEAVGGAVKFGNRTAPRAAIRTAADPGLAPMAFGISPTVPGRTMSVPMRGALMFPYRAEYDIGGDFAEDSGTYHTRRGTSFELNISVEVPIEERLYPRFTGAAAGADAEDFEHADLSLDDCFTIIQKGGDRLNAMSWALAVVNVGEFSKLADVAWVPANSGTVIPDWGERTSAYALCFLWYDAPEWSVSDPALMRYHIASGSAISSGGRYSTMAYRCVLTEAFVEPGRRYSVAVQLKLDSGSVGTGADPTPTWVGDGEFNVRVIEDGGKVRSFTYEDNLAPQASAVSGLWIFKGPTDSLQYLVRYGIRFSHKAPMFGGLGQRFLPWMDAGPIELGLDGGPLELGGHRFVDHTTLTAGTVTETRHAVATHGVGDAYVEVTSQYLTSGSAQRGCRCMIGPVAPPSTFTRWLGYGFGGTIYSANALRGHRLVQAGDGTAGVKGGISTILDYTESGASYRLNIVNGASTPAFTSDSAWIQSFRWNQRSLILSQLRVWKEPRSYAGCVSRAGFSLKGTIDLEDPSEPDLENLLACWPLDDGEGGLLREIVSGYDGATFPFSMARSMSGPRGKDSIFLSGEGEALVLDLSKNPIFLREFQAMQRDQRRGFAVEVTLMLPEAYYAIPEEDPNFVPSTSRWIARHAPDLVSWEVPDADETGLASAVQPLMVFGHRARVTPPTTAYRYPMGFQLEVKTLSDQDPGNPSTNNFGMSVAVPAWSGTTSFWDVDEAPWVGEFITFQFGVEWKTADTYNCYVNAFPAKYATDTAGAGDNEYTRRAEFEVRAKDVERSVIVVGGRWQPHGEVGYTELNARVFVNEVRVFGATAPGAIAAATTNVELLTDRTGKIVGGTSLPDRALDEDDLLHPLGESVRAANVTDASAEVTPPSGLSFYTSEPRDTLNAVVGTYLAAFGDDFERKELGTLPTVQEEFYYVEDVDSDGAALTLSTPYDGATRASASVASFRCVGYTDFRDSLFGKTLAFGSSKAFVPGQTTAKDVALSGDFFYNRAPVTGNWKVRVYSPLAGAGAARYLPTWVGGIVEPRKNPIRGIHSVGSLIFAGAGSSLYRVDDRWREFTVDGSVQSRFAFLARPIGRARVLAPTNQDRVVFDDVGDVVVNLDNLTEVPSTARGLYLEAEVELEDVRGMQTVLWLGSISSNPRVNAGNGPYDHRMNLWLRLVDGRPELVVGANVAVDGGASPPPQGYYVASTTKTIRPGKRTHLRWLLERDSSGWLLVPRLKIGGKDAPVTAEYRESGFSGSQWVDLASISDPSASTGLRLILGCARNAYSEPREDRDFQAAKMDGRSKEPPLYQGYLHVLNGALRNVAVVRNTAAALTPFPNFNPESYTYPAGSISMLSVACDEGVGHKLLDSAGGRYGLVYSHPFVTLFAEMGLRGQEFTFASFEDRLYCTSGGRPVVWDPDFGARFAGILPPAFSPSFDVERMPLWQPNERTAGDFSNDPVTPADPSDEDRINHFSTHGNAYLYQPFHKELTWEKGDAFVFKGLVRFRNVAGRIPFYEARTSTGSGGVFLECRDGRMVIGWYDTYQKKEAVIGTSSAVFEAGTWYYVFVDKRFPQADSPGDNWDDSIFGQTIATANALMQPWRTATFTVSSDFEDGETMTAGATTAVVLKAYPSSGGSQVIQYRMTSSNADLAAGAVTGSVAGAASAHASVNFLPRDRCIVRPFERQATPKTTYYAKADGTTHNAISFTKQVGPTGTTATGAVTRPDTTYTVTAPGVLTASTNPTFHPDMVGMLFQFGPGSPHTGVTFKVASYTSATQVTLSAYGGGAFPGPGDVVARTGAVFTGVAMLPEDGFEESTKPDETAFDLALFGSPLASYPLNGIDAFDGEFDSFGYVVTREPNRFLAVSSDPIETGTDTFAASIDSATAPGALAFSLSGDNFTVIHERQTPQVSTQPNQDLEVEQDASASANAETLQWRFIRAVDLLGGVRRVRVTFFDADQNVESNPSPELVISPAAEDRTNPSGVTRILLTNLPISSAPGRIYRRIYMSLQDGATPLLVGTLPDNTSTSFAIFKEEQAVATGVPVSFSRRAPPECGIVAVSQRTMFYGRLSDQPDLVLYSEAFRPEVVPPSNLLVFTEADGEPVTGMRDLDGRMIVFKRRGIFTVLIQPGVAIQGTVTEGVGAVNHNCIQKNEDRLYFLDVEGPYVMPTHGQPVFVGTKVSEFFRDGMDPSYFALVVATINDQRDQYVFTAKQNGDPYTDLRFATEFDHQSDAYVEGQKPPAFHRFTRYQTPTVTALGRARSVIGGLHRLIAGTDDGYLVWLERADTNLILLGADSLVWGDAIYTLDFGSTTTALKIQTGIPDQSFSGMRGAVARWTATDGSLVMARVLYSTAAEIHLDRPVTFAPAQGTKVVIGASRPYFKTKWLDTGVTWAQKRGYYLDVTRRVEASGRLIAETRKDFGAGVVDSKTLDLTAGFGHLAVQVKGDYVQVGLREHVDDAGTRFEVTDLVLRQDKTDQH